MRERMKKGIYAGMLIGGILGVGYGFYETVQRFDSSSALVFCRFTRDLRNLANPEYWVFVKDVLEGLILGAGGGGLAGKFVEILQRGERRGE